MPMSSCADNRHARIGNLTGMQPLDKQALGLARSGIFADSCQTVPNFTWAIFTGKRGKTWLSACGNMWRNVWYLRQHVRTQSKL